MDYSKFKKFTLEAGIDIRHIEKHADEEFGVQLATFAELIVKECVTKVAEWDMGIDHPVGATDNTSQVARDIVAEIKEHFGIKEE